MRPVALLTSLLAISVALPCSAEIEYTVEDLGPDGSANQTWAISQNGLVVGYSTVNGQTEGFFADGAGFKFIGTPPGTSRSDLLGVNVHGQAVGKSGTVNENGQAILWHDDGTPDGFTESLGTLGGSRSAGLAINDLAQVVGWSKLAGDAESRPFLWQDDEMTALPLLGGTQGSAEWINNAGQIVGASTTDADGLQQFAVLWDGGDPVRLPPEHAGLNNIARYIHDNGDIAGTVRLPAAGGGSMTRGAIWRDGQLHLELGTLADGTPVEPFASSSASGINSQGVVVGMSVNEQSILVPFVYRNGEMVQLSELVEGGWILDSVGAGAINDAGQIAVSGSLPGGSLRALLLTPVTPTSAPASTTTSLQLRASPNPFHGATIISLAGGNESATRVEVVDLRGRRVRSLVVSGEATARWDGRDERGRRVPAGVYFARVVGSDVGGVRVVRVR